MKLCNDSDDVQPRKRSFTGAEHTYSRDEPLRRLSFSLISADDREKSIGSPLEDSVSAMLARGPAHVTFGEEAPAERSTHSSFMPQVVKVPGFLRFPGNTVRSQKLANMIRQRLSESGLQLGSVAHLKPPAPLGTTSEASPSLEGRIERRHMPPVPPPPLQMDLAAVPFPPSSVPTIGAFSPPPPPLIPGIPAPPATPALPGGPPQPLSSSAGLSMLGTQSISASTLTGSRTGGTGARPFPGLPPNPPEELNINPFTAAYRNFPESSLRELYTFLNEVGKEIEVFAYRFLVEQHFHLSENNGNDASESRLSGGYQISRSDSTSVQNQRGKMTQPNYFSMAPKTPQRCNVSHEAGPLSNAELSVSAPFNSPNSHSDAAVFFSSAQQYSNSKSTDSIHSSRGEEDLGLMEGVSQKHKDALEDFPHCVDNNYFQYTEDWFEEFPLPCFVVEAKIAVTTEPPLFFAGMLMDPVSEKFLFGGSTFYEEARVLKVSVGKRTSVEESNNIFKDNGLITWINQQPLKDGPVKKIVKILFREYISICRAEEGFIVQTFSLLESCVKTDTRKNQLIPPSALPKLLEGLRPGAVTRAFSLQHVITLKSLQDEAMGEIKPSTIPDIPRLPPTVRGGESFRPTTLFTSNIVRRYSTTGAASGPAEKKVNASALWLKRRFRHENAVSSDHYAFLSDENPLRPLFETEMQQNAPMYVKPIDNIKAFLIFFKDTFSFHTMVQVLLNAVKCVQRFFRYSLGKKRRALTRMLRLWRHLESECRLKLQHYHPVPSSSERIDMIAANVLQPHMITTREYKEALIHELWEARREGYRKWCKERIIDGYLKQAGTTILSQGFRDVIPQIPSPSLRGIVSFSEVEPRLEQTMTTLYAGLAVPTSFTLRGPAPGSPMRGGTRVVAGGKNVYAAVEQSKRNRLDDEVHRLFGWYIEPEKLLYESHTRLLRSLKDSVLSMEEVQMEIRNMSLERAERRGAIVSAVEFGAFATPP